MHYLQSGTLAPTVLVKNAYHDVLGSSSRVQSLLMFAEEAKDPGLDAKEEDQQFKVLMHALTPSESTSSRPLSGPYIMRIRADQVMTPKGTHFTRCVSAFWSTLCTKMQAVIDETTFALIDTFQFHCDAMPLLVVILCSRSASTP